MPRRYPLAGLLLLMLAGVMAARTATAGGTVHPMALAQHPHAIVVDTRTSRAFVTSHGADRRSGVVSVFDTTTGKLVRTVRLGTYPNAIAVDERTTRVFIGDASAGRSPGPTDRRSERSMQSWSTHVF